MIALLTYWWVFTFCVPGPFLTFFVISLVSSLTETFPGLRESDSKRNSASWHFWSQQALSWVLEHKWRVGKLVFYLFIFCSWTTSSLELGTLSCWFAVDFAWHRSPAMKVDSITLCLHSPLPWGDNPCLLCWDNKWALIACSKSPGLSLTVTIEIDLHQYCLISKRIEPSF